MKNGVVMELSHTTGAHGEIRMMKSYLLIIPLILAACSAPTDEEHRAKYRRDLADEVASGDKSFEQAGCEYRGGAWDHDSSACDEFVRP